MMSKALLAVICVTLGAGGAYLVVRHADAAAPTKVATTTDPTPTATVEQSEGVVADPPAPAAASVAAAAPVAAPAPVAPAATVRRAETPSAPKRPSASTSRPTTPAPKHTDASTASVAPSVTPAPERREAPPLAIAPAAITDNQASRSVDPPGPVLEELVVAAQSVIGLQMETNVSSERARVEDAVVARVTRDVKIGDRVAIPAGAKANGQVTLVERGGRLRDRSRLGVRFTSIVLADGTRLPIETETIYREGDSPARESSAKIGGGAIGGAIIGGILGGAKGAAIGGSIGAGGGTAAVMAGGRNNATLPSGSPVTVRLEEPVTVTVER